MTATQRNAESRTITSADGNKTPGLWAKIRGKTAVDPIEKIAGLKKLKHVVTLLKENKADENYPRMVEAAAKALESGLKTDYKSTEGLLDLAATSGEEERQTLVGMFGKACESLKESGRKRVYRDLERELYAATVGLDEEGDMSHIDGLNSAGVMIIANGLEILGELRYGDDEIENAEVDERLLTSLRRAMYGVWNVHDQPVMLDDEARVACVRALWSNGEYDEDAWTRVLADKSEAVATFAAEKMLTLAENGGWDMLSKNLSEAVGRVAAVDTDNAREFVEEKLKTNRRTVLDGIAHSVSSGNMISQKVAAIFDAMAMDNKTRAVALSILRGVETLPEDGNVIKLAEQGKLDAVVIVGSVDPARARVVLQKLLDDKKMINVRAPLTEEERAKPENKGKRIKLVQKHGWVEAGKKLMASPNKETREEATAFMLASGKEIAGTAVAKTQWSENCGKVPVKHMERFLKWALNKKRPAGIRLLTLNSITKTKIPVTVLPKIIGVAKEADADVKTRAVALSIVANTRSLGDEDVPGMKEMVGTVPEALVVPAIAALVNSGNMAHVPLDKVKARLMSMEDLNSRRSLMLLLPVVAPGFGQDQEVIDTISELAGDMPADSAHCLAQYIKVGSELAIVKMDAMLRDSERVLGDDNAAMEAKAFTAIFTAQAMREGNKNAEGIFWEELVSEMNTRVDYEDVSEEDRKAALDVLKFISPDLLNAAAKESDPKRREESMYALLKLGAGMNSVLEDEEAPKKAKLEAAAVLQFVVRGLLALANGPDQEKKAEAFQTLQKMPGVKLSAKGSA